jgi:hypothetical protein
MAKPPWNYFKDWNFRDSSFLFELLKIINTFIECCLIYQTWIFRFDLTLVCFWYISAAWFHY